VQFKIAQKKVAIIATRTESKEFVADVQAVASQTGHEIESYRDATSTSCMRL
jgi:hypothetical protein